MSILLLEKMREHPESHQDDDNRKNVRKVFTHGDSSSFPLVPKNPCQHKQAKDSGSDIKVQETHEDSFFLNPDKPMAIPKKKIVPPRPMARVNHGILSAAPGTNTPMTIDPNIIFALSRKKSETTSSCPEVSIQQHHSMSIKPVNSKKWSGILVFVFVLSTIYFPLSTFLAPATADEFEAKEDLTVSGTGGTLKNPNVDIRGNVVVQKDLFTQDGAIAGPFGGLGQFQNLLLRSEDFFAIAWTISQLTFADGETAPDGTTDADLFTNSAAAAGYVEQAATISAAAAAEYTLSVWLKAGTSTSATIKITYNGTSPTNGDSGAITLDSNWRRFSIKGTTATDTTSITCRVTNNDTTSGRTMRAWGAQLEKASGPNVYVETAASAVSAGRGLVSGGFVVNNTGAITTGTIPWSSVTSKSVVSGEIADGTIANVDIASSAAIAGSKISPSFGAQDVSISAGNQLMLGPTAYFGIKGESSDNSIRVKVSGLSQRYFYVTDSYNSVDHMTVRMDNGNVGIGLTTPATRIDVKGATLTTQVDNTIGIANFATTVQKNDANTRTFSGLTIKPTFNTGASNANTTFDVLNIDSTNTAVTGLTTNLIKASYGGTPAFVVSSAGAITTGTIAWGSVTGKSVVSADIADGTIVTGDIGTDTILAGNIATGAVGTSELADGTVATGDIATDTILAGNIATGAVATAEILDATIVTGDIAADTILAGNIATGAVATAEILDATIVTGDIAADTILAGNIAIGAVATAEILDATIVTGDIAADTILAGNIATGAVGTDEIADGVVASADIADATIATADLANDAVTDAKAADDLTIASTKIGSFAGPAITSAGSDDKVLLLTQTLNDTVNDAGTQTYNGLKINLTETNKTGWDAVNLMDLQVGGTSKFRVFDDGQLTITGAIITSTTGVYVGGQSALTNFGGELRHAWASGFDYQTFYADGVERMRLDIVGNVGIGTANPQTKLEVAGDINTPYGGIGLYENLLVRSEAFATTWTVSQLTFADGETAPDGTTNADLFTNSAAAAGYVEQAAQISAAAAADYVFSVWLKSGTSTSALLNITFNGTSPTDGASGAITLDSTWRRFSIKGTTSASSNTTSVTCRITNNDTANGKTIRAWGAQLEKKTTPSVYVETGASAVTASRGLVTNADLRLVNLTLGEAGALTFGGDAALERSGANIVSTASGDSFSVAGNLTVNGNTTLGDASGDTFTVDLKGTTTAETILFELGTNDTTFSVPAPAAPATLTFPAATDTLVGRATTDTLTNKTYDANGTGNVLSNVDFDNMMATLTVDEATAIRSETNNLTIGGATNKFTFGDGVITEAGTTSITSDTVNATTFDTNVAAAAVTLAGTTLAADGTDANISLILTPKGTGGIGIGTTGPVVDLQIGSATFTPQYGVYENARVGLLVGEGAGSGGMVAIQLSSTYNNATYPNYGLVLVNGPNTTSYDTWGIMHDGPAKATGGLQFAYAAQGTNIHVATPMVTFQKSGNVGIGTTSPLAKLDISGFSQMIPKLSVRTSGAPAIEFGHTNSAGYGSALGATEPTGRPYLAFNAESETTGNTFRTRGIVGRVIYSDLVGGVKFSRLTNANATGQTPTDDVIIDSTGSVGIGTTNPQTKLEVAGDINTPYGGIGLYENLLVRSEAFATTWTASQLTFADGETAPDATTNADLFTNSATAPQYVEQVATISAAAAADYVFSVWLKSGTSTSALLNITFNGTNPTDGASGAITLDSTWRRFSIKGTTSGSSNTTSVTCRITNNDTSNGKTMRAWGAQLEKKTTPSVYVETVASAVTASRGLVTNADLRLVNLTLGEAGALTFGGDAALERSGANTLATASGDSFSVAGNLTVNGNTTLGDASGDTFTVDLKGTTTAETILFELGTNDTTFSVPAPAAPATLTFPAATDTLVGRATTDTLTNKTYDANGTGNVLSNVDFDNMMATLTVDEVTAIRSETNNLTIGGATNKFTFGDGIITEAGTTSVTSDTVNATTFDTNVAAAAVTLAGTTLAADGTDANISLILTPKGTGSVGIGTTSPGTLLQLSGATDPEFSVTDTTNSTMVRIRAGDSVGRIYTSSAHDLVLSAGSANDAQLTIDSGGANVGIGTTGPGTKLDVAGKIRGNSWLNLNNTGLVGDAGGDARPAVIFGATDTAAGWFFGPTTSAAVASTTMGIYRWGLGWAQVWDPAGNVGIGTTSPSQPLHVLKNQNGETYAYVQNTTAGTGATARVQATADTFSLYMRMHSSAFTTSNQYIANGGLLEANGAGGLSLSAVGGAYPIQFWINSAEKMRVHTDGNVGIGTTSPGARLSIWDNTSDESQMIRLGASSVADYKIYRQQVDGTLIIQGTQDGFNNFSYKDDAGNVLFRILESGNVGVGTANPQTKLEVAGDINTPYGGIGLYENLLLRSEIFGTTWTASQLTIADGETAPDGTTNADLFTNSAAATGYVEQAATISAAAAADYVFSVWLKSGTSTSALLNITFNGTSPTNGASGATTIDSNWRRFSIKGTTATDTTTVTCRVTNNNTTISTTMRAWGAQLEKKTSPSVYVETVASAVAASRGLVSNADSVVTGTQVFNGSVGIGTTGPNSKLHLIGRAFIDNSAGAHGLAGNPGLVVDGASSEDIARFRDVSGNTLVVISSAGLVGIGATTPNNRLEVLSTTTPQHRIAYDASNYVTTAVSSAGAVTLNATGASAGFTFSDPITASVIYGGSTSTSDLFLRPTSVSGTTGSDIHLQNGNGLEIMVLLDNGNVGIGPASPNNRLEVLSTTTPQHRIAYDASNYVTTAVSSAGAVTLDATGASAGFTISDGLIVSGTFTGNGILTLGDGGDTAAINSSDWDISTTGAMTLIDSMSNTSANLALSTVTSGNITLTTAGNITLTTAAAAVTNESLGVKILNQTTNTTTDNTNKYGLYLNSTGSFTGSTGAATNNWGIYVSSATGADNNYGAYFDSNVGIGVNSPTARLQVSTSYAPQTPLKDTGIGTVTPTTADWNMGYKFTMNRNGQITRLGIKTTGTARTIRLYNFSNGTVLASATITPVSATTWTYIDITPVNVTSGTSYLVAARSGASNYAQITYTTPVTIGDITINDNRYSAATDLMPTTVSTATMYGVCDVTFVPTASSDPAAVFQGNVGIGTTSPGQELHVAGDILVNSGNWYYGSNAGATDQPLIRSHGSGYNQAGYPGVQVGQTGDHIALFIDPTTIPGGTFAGNTNEIFTPNYMEFVQANSGGTDWLRYVLTLNNGSVGIGTTSPSAKLHVSGAGGATLPQLLLTNTAAAASQWPTIEYQQYLNGNTGYPTFVISTGGGTSASPTITPVSQLLGGYVWQVYDAGWQTAAGIHAYSTANFAINDRETYLTFSTTDGTTTGARMRIDHTGLVGIGTTNPTKGKLHIDASSASVSETLALTNLGDGIGRGAAVRLGRHNTYFVQIASVSTGADPGYPNDSLVFNTMHNSATATERVRIQSDGNVGIGTTSPGNLLTIQQTSATDPIADAWTTYSSRRWKENIVPIDDPLLKVQQLQGVYFDWKADGKHDLGFIAEDVGQVLPEVVAYEENGVDAKSVDYARITALLVEAMKEQQKQIEELKKEIEKLKKQ